MRSENVASGPLISDVIDVESAAEMIGLASAAAFGKWRDDRNILLTKTKRVGVQSAKIFL